MSAAAVGLLDSERSRESDGADTCEEIVAAARHWCGILAEYHFFFDKTPTFRNPQKGKALVNDSLELSISLETFNPGRRS